MVRAGEGCVLITGCDSGMGMASTLHLAGKGFHIFAGCLNEEKMVRAARPQTPRPTVAEDALVRSTLESPAAESNRLRRASRSPPTAQPGDAARDGPSGAPPGKKRRNHVVAHAECGDDLDDVINSLAVW